MSVEQRVSALGCIYCRATPAKCRFNSAPVCWDCICKMTSGKGGWWEAPPAIYTSIELGFVRLKEAP